MAEKQPYRQPDAKGPPRVPEGSRVYAIGDVHGRLDLLTRLFASVRADAESAPPRRVLILLGDYVDRGPRSAEVVDLLIDSDFAGIETVFLKGNHEDLMLAFLRAEPMGEAWLANGGLATLRSYGVDPFDPAAVGQGFEFFRDGLARALPGRHRDFLRRLSASHLEGDYLFVHAGIRPSLPLGDQNDQDLMWIRGSFLESRLDHGKVVVHGHTITDQPDIRPNRIGIDTGAYRSGVLTCLVLEGAERRFLST